MPNSTRKSMFAVAGIPAMAVLVQLARIVLSNHSNRHHCPHTEKAFYVGCFDGRLNLDHARRLIKVISFFKLIFGHDFSLRIAGGAAGLLIRRDRETLLEQIYLGKSFRPIEEINLFAHLDCKMLELATAPGGELANYDATTVEGLFEILQAVKQVLLDGWNERFPEQPIKVNVCVTRIGLSPLGLPKTSTSKHPTLVRA